VLSQVSAEDFLLNIDRNYFVNSDSAMNLEETHRVKNNSFNLLISADNKETFVITTTNNDLSDLNKSLSTIKAFVNGKSTNFESEVSESQALVYIKYPKEIRSGETIEFKLEYEDYSLVNPLGAIIDIYLPGFDESINFTQGNTTTSYTTNLFVNKSLPELNFVFPEPTKVESDNNFIKYNFLQESLVGSNVWMQLGTKQFFKFSITQKVEATVSSNDGFFNEYKIILPRNVFESKITQEVYFSQITPELDKVTKDSQGNIIGHFKIPAFQNTQIVIEGFAIVQNKIEKPDFELVGEINDIPEEIVKNNTNPAIYWESNSTQIQDLAKKIVGTETNVKNIVTKVYEYVVDTIDYSEVKKFGINNRQGALATLNNGSGVCMEYSDLFLTLLRSIGIPARAAFGYGYDSRFVSDDQQAHQWVEVYMPGINNWVSVDVTWGESGQTVIGGDLNHFYTHTASVSPNSPAMVERISFGEDIVLEAPSFQFDLLEKIVVTDDLTPYFQLIENYENANSQFNFSSILNKSNLPNVLIGSGIAVIFIGLLIFILATSKKKI